ncbi:putative secreted protein [Streptomyces davaonensis JCM 4913]|uniref:Putative secreted protein n=1 Tax=Streptomyces davaonensis (strain DSM 101723 / JCM 4913 / KCC S-0913 / 768) TaxID=1214101 RepID=K4R6X5_STRDJ|nr:putative secreted protein [Streptomyces davaonensis JCM 4913]
MRIAAAAAGLAGVLALSGCSDDSSDEGSPSASATPSTTETADTGGGSGDDGGTAAPAGELEGSWLATTDGKAVALVVTGSQAGLFATGGTVCSGTAGETIRLKCTDGSEDRATGTVDSVDKDTLKVTWDGELGAETYRKAEGATLPTGLPTEGLGS